ncbi:unnamed protein product [Calypogeia fissa]
MSNGPPEQPVQARHPPKGGPKTDKAQSRGGPVGTPAAGVMSGAISKSRSGGPAARVASGGTSGGGHKRPKPGHIIQSGSHLLHSVRGHRTHWVRQHPDPREAKKPCKSERSHGARAAHSWGPTETIGDQPAETHTNCKGRGQMWADCSREPQEKSMPSRDRAREHIAEHIGST